MASFSNLIQLPSDIINLVQISAFQTSNAKFNEVKAPTGSNTEDMPAAQEILSLFSSFQGMLNEYSSLISYDGERMTKIVNTFVQKDKSY